jgi:ribosomal protein S18 acetylase RimI-like enzyme
MKIVKAETPDHLRWARCLFDEYGATLPPELWLDDFRREVDGLPGEYGAPFGRLVLAVTDDGQAAGCAALRRWGADTGEMKRMYVRPIYRGRGIGKTLALAIIHEAANIGYKRIVLDTAPTMTAAIRLYEVLGFQRIEPYRHYPIDDVIFLQLVLNPKREIST